MEKRKWDEIGLDTVVKCVVSERGCKRERECVCVCVSETMGEREVGNIRWEIYGGRYVGKRLW